MQNIIIASSERTPEINLDFVNGRFSIKGEAYPEDAAIFFGPLLIAVKEYLQAKPAGEVIMDIHLEYFNSSSAKALMNLLKIMDESAAKGVGVVVYWYYNRDDDTMQEHGEDLSEDIRFLRFEMMGIE